MIRMVEDAGADLAVIGVDLLSLEVAPDWNEWATYLMAVGGYAGGFLGFGGNLLKNIGIAAAPLAARSLRARLKGGATQKIESNRLTFRPASKASINVPVPVMGVESGIIVTST